MSSSYTVLRVTPAGAVPLFDAHVGRLGEASREALLRFKASAGPGLYRVTFDGAQLLTAARPASRLVEGMPSRFAVSPFAAQQGRFPKPSPPSRYDEVRVEGVATLLTDAKGELLFESCAAALVAWDGARLVLPPLDAPGVASLAEARVAELLPHRRAPLQVRAAWPLLLINAAAGSCEVSVPGREPFPPDVRAPIDAALA